MPFFSVLVRPQPPKSKQMADILNIWWMSKLNLLKLNSKNKTHTQRPNPNLLICYCYCFDRELRTELRRLKFALLSSALFLSPGMKFLKFCFANRKSPSLSFQMTHSKQKLDKKWRFCNDLKNIKRKQTPCSISLIEFLSTKFVHIKCLTLVEDPAFYRILDESTCSWKFRALKSTLNIFVHWN